MRITIFTFLSLLFLVSCDTTDYPQTEFFVRGNCGMCEDRIEDTIEDLDGVKKVEWDQATKTAKVWYDAALVNQDQMEKAAADAGHETEKFQSPEAVYNALPMCCKKFEDQK